MIQNLLALHGEYLNKYPPSRGGKPDKVGRDAFIIMKEEERLASIIKFMNDGHALISGTNKAALLKSAAAYFEFRVAAEATKEVMIQAFNNLTK